MIPESVLRIGRLFVTGVTMGIVHVLTGPDHLSALATLSANINDKNAFYLGAQWGVGHSTGLICVAAILISLDNVDRSNEDDESIVVSDKLQTICESIVGIIMILLGCHGMFSAKGKMHGNQLSLEISSPDEDENIFEKDYIPGPLNAAVNDDLQSMRMVSFEIESNKNQFMEKHINPIKDYHSHNHDHTLHNHSHLCKHILLAIIPCKVGRNKQQLIALIVGIVHGIAGPGGILGVIPAVHLHNWLLALIYLMTFCSTSIVTMGCFARTYGILTKHLSGKNFSCFCLN